MSPEISDRLGDRLKDWRTRSGLTQEQLAEAARAAGADESVSATVVSSMESGRPKDGQRTRLFTLDELPALAAALKVTPLELLGEDAALFAGDGKIRTECPTCQADPGPLERTVRADLDGLGDLTVMEATLAETAYRLAGGVDRARGDELRALPSLTKELRATLEQIAAGRRATGGDDDEFADLDEPE